MTFGTALINWRKFPDNDEQKWYDIEENRKKCLDCFAQVQMDQGGGLYMLNWIIIAFVNL